MTDRYTIGHGAGYLGRKPECWIRRDGQLSYPADMTMGDAREYVRGFEDGRARQLADCREVNHDPPLPPNGS